LSSPEESTDAEPVLEKRSESLGKATGSGFSWLSLSLASGRVFSFVSLLVLGHLLLDEDFGVFAIATSVAAFLQCFRDGGVQRVLVQNGKDNYARLCGPAFWIGFWFSATAGCLLAAVAPLVANYYDAPKVSHLLWVIAIALPLSMPATMLFAKLQIELRFKTLAKISVTSMFLRHCSAILFAYLGYGAISFVLPLILVALFEAAAGFAATRATPWLGGQQLRVWPELLGKSTWELANASVRGFANNGDYLVLGKLVSKGLLGHYSFGYQLTVQMLTMLAMGFNQVLFPILSRLAGEPLRFAQALLRSTRAFLLVSTGLNLAVAAGIAPLEELVWQGKWAAAVPLMQVFALLAPLRGASAIIHSAIAAKANFRLSTLITLLQGAVLMLSAGLSYYFFGPSLTKLALGVSVAQILLNNTITILVFHSVGLKLSDWSASVIPSYFVGCLAVGASLALDQSLAPTVTPALRLLATVTCFGVLYGLLGRLFLRDQLQDMLEIAPQRITRPLRRVLFLSPVNSSGSGLT